ncbi:MAG: KpsF/GutQ family sugar-phosphate isomerase [Planctomycetota bacterium]|nr:MAG: KpsF/GutQ family sugar-phosphate isomerase [Planctomycetota bacterium]
MSDDRIQRMAAVLRHEAHAILSLADSLPQQQQQLDQAVALILQRTGDGALGRLVTTGVGKAGLIGRKISATFASTGTPGFFLHPAEALHGDLGMVAESDVVLALSNSGASDELTALLPAIAHLGAPVIAVCGAMDSPLARHARVCLDLGKPGEACPLGLAPSTTTTAMLAIGDALALAVCGERAFSSEQYARFHPGGALGRKLMTCAEAMRSGQRLALVSGEEAVLSAMQKIGAARAGSAVVCDANGTLLGILTDGDIRRALTRHGGEVLAQSVAQHATMPCRSIQHQALLTAALHTCAQFRINELPVLDEQQRVLGLIDIQDLISRGFDIAHPSG